MTELEKLLPIAMKLVVNTLLGDNKNKILMSILDSEKTTMEITKFLNDQGVKISRIAIYQNIKKLEEEGLVLLNKKPSNDDVPKPHQVYVKLSSKGKKHITNYIMQFSSL